MYNEKSKGLATKISTKRFESLVCRLGVLKADFRAKIKLKWVLGTGNDFFEKVGWLYIFCFVGLKSKRRV